MGISINSNLAFKPLQGHTKKNSAYDLLQQRKDSLNKQIESINNSKVLDDKTKQEKIKGIQEQIKEVDKQMVQAKLDETKKEAEKAQTKAKEKSEQKEDMKAEQQNPNGVIVSDSMSDIASANQDIESYKSLKKLRTKLKGQTNVANAEMKESLMETPGGSTPNLNWQLDTIARNTSSLAGIASDMSSKAEDVKLDVNKASSDNIKQKEVADRAQKNEKDKEKNDELNIPNSIATPEGDAAANSTNVANDNQVVSGDNAEINTEAESHEVNTNQVHVQDSKANTVTEIYQENDDKPKMKSDKKIDARA